MDQVHKKKLFNLREVLYNMTISWILREERDKREPSCQKAQDLTQRVKMTKKK